MTSGPVSLAASAKRAASAGASLLANEVRERLCMIAAAFQLAHRTHGRTTPASLPARFA